MSHEVEGMAYTNEVPWHGLGTYVQEAPNVKEMLNLAKLDWTVDREEMTLAKNGQPVEGFASLVRSSDNKVLDVVGSRYIPAQNQDVFEFFSEFVNAGSATMETAGSLDGGRYVWGLAALNESFEVSPGDKVNGYLLAASPHQQGKSLIMKFTSVRVVCKNTMASALRKGEGGARVFRMTHRRQFDKEAIKQAKDTLGMAREQMSEFKENASRLHRMTINDDEARRVFVELLTPGKTIKDFEDEASRKALTLDDVYRRAPGAEVGTAWGVLNAVTYYADHVVGRSPDRRLTNAWMGKMANMKERCLETLLA